MADAETASRLLFRIAADIRERYDVSFCHDLMLKIQPTPKRKVDGVIQGWG
jgi:hypothetical protein